MLLLGSGGREHSLALSLAKSPRLGQLWIAPGNAGTQAVGTNVAIDPCDGASLVAFAKQHAIDITLVGPEAPLVLGIVDQFEDHNLVAIGPNRAAAQLEGSKQWAKDFMSRHGIPTAYGSSFTQLEPAVDYLERRNRYPVVIKACGLAGGKGVCVADHASAALSALRNCLEHRIFGDAGSTVVIEDFLVGEEVSFFCVSGRPVISAHGICTRL